MVKKQGFKKRKEKSTEDIAFNERRKTEVETPLRVRDIISAGSSEKRPMTFTSVLKDDQKQELTSAIMARNVPHVLQTVK